MQVVLLHVLCDFLSYISDMFLNVTVVLSSYTIIRILQMIGINQISDTLRMLGGEAPVSADRAVKRPQFTRVVPVQVIFK